jgi:hypothetical protein
MEVKMAESNDMDAFNDRLSGGGGAKVYRDLKVYFSLVKGYGYGKGVWVWQRGMVKGYGYGKGVW